MEDKASSVLKLQELPTQTLRQTLDQLQNRASSLISISLQWKDLDSHFASLHTAIQEREKQLQSTQYSVQQKLEDLNNRETRLDEFQKSLDDKSRDIEARENDFQKSRREIEAVKESVERDSRLIQLKEDKFELLNNSVNEKTKELKEIEERVNQAKKEIEIKEKEIEQLLERSREVALKEKEIDEYRKELDLKADKFKDLELKEKLIQEWAEEVELEKNKYMELCKDIEFKQKQLNDNVPVPGFSVTIVGKALQIYLNEHWGDYESMRNAVSMVLVISSDPSMLVLDALEGFYPPHLKTGDKEFEEEVVRRSCILVLEQLMKLSPEIRPPVKKQARTIAISWLRKLNSRGVDSLEVLGFLLLLACYGLASSFHADKLLTRLEIISHHSLAPQLFMALGLTNRLTDFIQNLIRKKKLNEAIRYINAFGKVSEYQPASLLTDFLRISKIATKQMRKKDKSLEGQIKAANKRLADIKYALRCIEEYKIEFGPSLKNLEQHVEWLEKEISKKKAAELAGDKIQNSQHEKEENSTLPVTAVDSPVLIPVTASATSSPVASTSVPATPTQPQQLSGNKHPRRDELAGKGLNECHIANQASPTSSTLASTSISATTAESQQSSGNKCPRTDVSAGKSLEECHGADQAFATSSTLASTSVPATTTQPQQLSEDKCTRTDVSAGNISEECHGSDQAPAISSTLAATSVPATASQPQQLSGNKHPRTDDSAGNFLKECHGADQASATSCTLASTSLPATVTQSQQLNRNECPRADISAVKSLEECHGSDQASATSSTLAATSVPATVTQPKQWSGIKDPGTDVTGGKKLKACHGADQASATTSTLASTSVPATVTQPKQLSGNKRPGTEVTGGKNLQVCHGADQGCEQPSLDDLPSESNEASASLNRQPKTNRFSVNPSKEELKKLLDMCEKHELEDCEIAAALRSACDPGKLVLDVMNVPVPFKLDKSKEFKAHLRKTSCLLLLKQFRTISPKLNLEIRQEAKKFALHWESTVAKKGKKGPVDVVCFLQFLACFKLGFIFHAFHFLDLLDTDHWRKDSPDLCEVLGLADKIPSFIENRLKKGQHLEAVKYIYALDVVEKFPPAPILKDYLSISSKKSGKKPIEAQIVDIDKEIKSLKDVIKCVRDYKITDLSPEKLEESILQLEKEKEKKQDEFEALKHITRPISPPSARRTYASSPRARAQQGSRNKRRRTHISPENRPKPYPSAKSDIYRRPLQHPPRLYMDRGGPSMNSPPRNYGWAAYPPHDSELNNYGAPVTHSYHWDALRNFGHGRPFHY